MLDDLGERRANLLDLIGGVTLGYDSIAPGRITSASERFDTRRRALFLEDRQRSGAMERAHLLPREFQTVAAAAADHGGERFEGLFGGSTGLLTSKRAEVVFGRGAASGDFDRMQQEIDRILWRQ